MFSQLFVVCRFFHAFEHGCLSLNLSSTECFLGTRRSDLHIVFKVWEKNRFIQ